jgi:hypothetical protein
VAAVVAVVEMRNHRDRLVEALAEIVQAIYLS